MRPSAFETNSLAPVRIQPQPYAAVDVGGQLGSLIDAIEDSAQPVCIYRAKRYLYVNRAYATMLGFNATDELLQLSDIISLVHPDDRPMAGTATRARLAGEHASTRHEFQMLRREGSVIWVETVGSHIRWEGQSAALVFANNITDRKLIEEALQQSERLFSKMFHSSPDVMILSTVADGRLVEVNDTFLKLRQLKREDVIGRTGAELGLWHDGAERERVIEAVRIDGMARNIPSAHQSLDPEKGLRHYAASAELVRLGEDELLLWVARDITDLRRTEEELRRSKRDAEEASRAKSEFLAHMSHELRTPLNAILGFSEVIRDRVYGPDASSKYTEYAECIYSAGEHLLQIINDVLALSKVEHGKLTLQESDFSAEELINDCLRMVRQAAKKAGLQLNASPVDPKLVIRADERLMRQVLLNLLSNAIKFTPPQGRVSLSIEVLRPTNGARIIVSDTGIGMSEADIAIALTPFGQIEGGLTRRDEGTGLGLPLTRSLVELHGGELKVRSEPNVGTTVAITLPTERTVSSSSIDKPTEMPVR